MRIRPFLFAIVTLALGTVFVADARAAFVAPSTTPAGAAAFTNWNRGDTDSTYQQWRGSLNGGAPALGGGAENFTTDFGLNQPDNDYYNPNGIATAQYLDATRNSSGTTSVLLISGTQNIYSFEASADFELLSPDYGYGSNATTTVILQMEVLGNELLIGSTTPGNPLAPNTVKVDGYDWVDHVETYRIGAGGGGDAVGHWFRFELPTNAASHVVEFDSYHPDLGAFDPELYGHVSISAIGLDTLTAPAPALEGDLNGDGFVGVDDLNVVLVNWNQNVPPGDVSSGDVTGEGFVGVDDLNVVLVNWNNGTPPGAGSAVPEPSTIVLLTSAGFALLTQRRLKRG